MSARRIGGPFAARDATSTCRPPIEMRAVGAADHGHGALSCNAGDAGLDLANAAIERAVVTVWVCRQVEVHQRTLAQH